MSQTLIVRYSETTLKGGNRSMFENQMGRNLAVHLKALGGFTVQRQTARALVRGEGDMDQAVALLTGLPGVANVSPALLVEREPENLERQAAGYMENLLLELGPEARQKTTFKVMVERKDKRYPLTSMELAPRLGAAVLERLPELKVAMTGQEYTLWVEIWDEGAVLYHQKIPGPGGLAVGTSGKAICLLSGGIDSPVAAYRMMTRGCPVIYLHFHSYPYIGEQSKEKIRELVRFMARYQPASRLYIAPFAQTQEAIRDKCPEGYRTVLYRRMMNRLANRLARREGALAILSGDSMGQVASQTMENIVAIQDTAEMAVLQPLMGMNKQEVIDQARRLGTYAISIQPYPDCCTLFQPKRPETHAKLETVRRWEAGLPMEELLEAMEAGLERYDFGPEYFPPGWE